MHDSIKLIAKQFFQTNSKQATCQFDDAENIFNIIFSEDEPPLVAHFKATDDFGQFYPKFLEQVHQQLSTKLNQTLAPIAWQEHTILKVSAEKLLLYDLSFNSLYHKMKSLFNENEIFLITDNNDFVPVILGGKPRLINDIIQEATIRNTAGEFIPVRELLNQNTGYDLKTIIAGKEGEFYPIVLDPGSKKPEHSFRSNFYRQHIFKSKNDSPTGIDFASITRLTIFYIGISVRIAKPTNYCTVRGSHRFVWRILILMDFWSKH
jgi:hypothetical protein